MNIYCLMVNAKNGERERARRKSNDAKREICFDGGSSKNRLEIQDKRRFMKWVSSEVPSKFPKASGDRVCNPKSKKGKGPNSPTEKPTCGKCGKKHYSDCLKGTYNCFGCGKNGHKVRSYPNVRTQDKGSGHAQASGSNDVQKKQRFYALHSRGEQEIYLDVVTGMLKVFNIDVYALLGPGAT